jgi:hypothetical protein
MLEGLRWLSDVGAEQDLVLGSFLGKKGDGSYIGCAL